MQNTSVLGSKRTPQRSQHSYTAQISRVTTNDPTALMPQSLRTITAEGSEWEHFLSSSQWGPFTYDEGSRKSGHESQRTLAMFTSLICINLDKYSFHFQMDAVGGINTPTSRIQTEFPAYYFLNPIPAALIDGLINLIESRISCKAVGGGKGQSVNATKNGWNNNYQHTSDWIIRGLKTCLA